MPSESERSAPFRVVIFGGVEPRILRRLIDKIHRDVPEACVCGILYHTLRPLSGRERVHELLRNLKDPKYAGYVATRIGQSARSAAIQLGRTGLKLLHGHFPSRDGREYSIFDLVEQCRVEGRSIRVTTDVHNEDSLDFVRGLRPDLAIVYGTPILKPKLFELPRLGSINIHQRKLPDYRGGGPIGLWELLDDQPEIGVTIHRVVKSLDAGAIIGSGVIPIEPFDTLESLALKAHVIGIDLLTQAVADFARGEVQETVQAGPSRMFRSPKPSEMSLYRKQLDASRSKYVPDRGRSTFKLLIRTLLLMPFAALRNWRCRLTGTFPIIVLYHHLLADRPHFMGISTEAFVEQIKYLKRYYQVVDLETARKMLESGSVTAPTVVLTFDDGYKDNYLRLRAAALTADIPATLLVCSQRIDASEAFEHDVQRGFHRFPPLTWDEARELEQWGYRLQSHTRSHFDCGSTDPALLHDEIVGSKAELEEQLGHAVEVFSFPTGLPANISRPALELARATYSCVLTAYGGVNIPDKTATWWHLFRRPHPNSLWELELTLQSILDLGQPPLWLGGQAAEPPARVQEAPLIPK